MAVLPLQFTRFFGREAEIKRVTAMLVGQKTLSDAGATRLVTVTGPGGCGKSRFIFEIARRVAPDFGEAVYFAPLAALSDPRQITHAVAEALNLPLGASEETMESIVRHLSEQPALLILDNMEQLLVADNPLFRLRNPKSADGAAFVWRLLTLVPHLTCLVTSRQALELNGEREFPLPPLPVPDGATFAPEQLLSLASVQLFVDRAQAATPDFQLTPRNAESVAALCVKLEGIPLALELAAARARVFSPAQMLGQLSRRFDFLVSRQRNAEERHRTLWSAIEWSFFHLPPELRDFFARLSVFRGGWIIEAAQAVCCDQPEDEDRAHALDFASDCLSQLRVHSLLLAEARDDAEYRFRMLEMLREFAQAHLRPPEEQEAKRQHALFFARLVKEAMPHLTGGDQARWLERLSAEHDNFRAALDWCAAPEGDGKIGLEITRYLWRFWERRGFLAEGRDRIERLLEHPDAQAQDAARGDTLSGVGNLAIQQADYSAARAFYEKALAIRRACGDEKGIAGSLNNMGLVALNVNEYESARSLMEEALARYRAQANQMGMGMALSNLGRIAQQVEDYPASLRYFEEALALNRERENRSGESLNLGNIGVSLIWQGDPDGAEIYLTQALEISRELGDRSWQATLLGNLGVVASGRGDYNAAERFYAECLRTHSEIGHKRGIQMALADYAGLAMERGDYTAAARLFSVAEGMREAIGTKRHPQDQSEIERAIVRARQHLGAEDFQRIWREARKTPLEQTIQTLLQEAKLPPS